MSLLFPRYVARPVAEPVNGCAFTPRVVHVPICPSPARWRACPEMPPARGLRKMRARRVQGTTGSHPVSGTAEWWSGRAAQGVPRSRKHRIRVRTTRRRTTIRTPAPRLWVIPGTTQPTSTEAGFPRPIWVARALDERPDGVTVHRSRGPLAVAVVVGWWWPVSTTSRGYLSLRCVLATGVSASCHSRCHPSYHGSVAGRTIPAFVASPHRAIAIGAIGITR